MKKHRHLRSATTALLIGSLSFVVSACGKSVSEKIAEKAVEKQTGVEIDQAKDGSMKMKTKDGSIETGTGKVPAGFPKDVALPKGKVTTSMTAKVDGKQSWMVTVETDDVSKTSAELKTAWTKSGYKIESEFDQNTDGKQSTMVVAKKGEETVVGMGEQASGEKGSLIVSVEKPA
jgi:outer membrane lipoprotein-sorting protein